MYYSHKNNPAATPFFLRGRNIWCHFSNMSFIEEDVKDITFSKLLAINISCSTWSVRSRNGVSSNWIWNLVCMWEGSCAASKSGWYKCRTLLHSSAKNDETTSVDTCHAQESDKVKSGQNQHQLWGMMTPTSRFQVSIGVWVLQAEAQGCLPRFYLPTHLHFKYFLDYYLEKIQVFSIMHVSLSDIKNL